VEDAATQVEDALAPADGWEDVFQCGSSDEKLEETGDKKLKEVLILLLKPDIKCTESKY